MGGGDSRLSELVVRLRSNCFLLLGLFNQLLLVYAYFKIEHCSKQPRSVCLTSNEIRSYRCLPHLESYRDFKQNFRQ